MSEYNKPFYNAVNFNVEDTQITFGPRFLCPVCAGRPTYQTNKVIVKQKDTPFNFHGQVAFVLPCCQTQITLNVAIHCDNNIQVINISSPEYSVPTDWWRPP